MHVSPRAFNMIGKPGKGPGSGPPMSRPVQKARDFKGTLTRLLAYLKPYRWQLLLVFLVTILSTLFNILGPKITGKAITSLFDDMMMKLNGIPGAKVDFDYIQQIIITLGSLYLMSAVFNYIQQFIMVNITQKTVFDIRNDIDDKLSRLPLEFFDSRTHGEILSRVTNDVDNISSTLQQIIIQLLTSIITLVGIVIIMITINPMMTLISLVPLPLYILITKITASHSQKHFKQQQKTLGELSGHIEEMFTGHKIVKAFGHETKCINEFNDINEKLYDAGWKAQFISGMIQPLIIFVSSIAYVLVSVAGAILVIHHVIQVGDIHAFLQYSRQIQQPIMQTANIANIIQSTMASAERVFELLDELEETPDSNNSPIIEYPKGDIKFQNVKFRYKDDTPLIEDMNIDVKSGQTIAIVGPTGAGKTTLVNLLMRFYDIDSGQITVDGVNIKDLKRGELRSMFGMVLQDTWLFNATIRDNIAYGREGASEQDIIQAAKAAYAHYFIRHLPEGYDTILNEEASNLSQGQKQLLTIARAILADPAILILDEATSSVDTRTEINIQKAMVQLMQGRTSFVIAHRLSTIRDADLILVMNNGSIIEKGKHAELLAADGFYADLYNSQFTVNQVG